MRTTYHRRKGTEQFFGLYDVHADCLDGLFRERKRLPELIEAFQWLRRCYPDTKLYVVMDNLHQTPDHPRFLALLKRLRIHPVWTPTDASWPTSSRPISVRSSASRWPTPMIPVTRSDAVASTAICATGTAISEPRSID
jgi:hypothetical protein